MIYYILLFSLFYSSISCKAVTYAELSGQISKSAQIGSGQTELFEMEKVFVKGGCFDMGDISGEGDDDERPVHQVCVDDFYIGRYEVTQREWIEVMGNNPSFFINCEDCPVENVSHDDAREFIRRLNLKSKLKYRLPTEAEWEYAARSGGNNEKWAGVNSAVLFSLRSMQALPLSEAKNDEMGDYAWYKDNSGGRTHPVGQKRANGLGLYDMCGNVQEWVNDWYEHDYYKVSPHVKSFNPKGPTGGQYKTSRGGAWLNKQWGIRTSLRFRFTPDDRGREFGFRLAASPSVPE